MPQVLSPSATSETPLEALVCTLKALADESRLKILEHLVLQDAGCPPGESVCACDLEGVTGLSQPTVSHHMRCLIDARLVIGEKRGRWMYYRIDPTGFDRVKTVLTSLGG